MEQKLIIPITPEDFGIINNLIGIDQDTICLKCEGPLKTSSEGIFSAGIYYSCLDCGAKFKKTAYRDFRTKQDYFRLEEVKNGGIA